VSAVVLVLGAAHFFRYEVLRTQEEELLVWDRLFHRTCAFALYPRHDVLSSDERLERFRALVADTAAFRRGE
jgi:hypothetical protein